MAEANSQIDINVPPSKRPVTVTKPIPYTFDLGNLLCSDANPLPLEPSNALVDSTARDCAQSLMNQLLTTVEIRNTPDGPAWILPPPTTALPREKPLPRPKEPTKWEKFAAKKGIAPKRKEGKMVYDEEKGEWVPKWGYKGKNKDGEEDWLVEVDEKKEVRDAAAGDARRERREERKERIRRQERRMRTNERRAAKGSGG